MTGPGANLDPAMLELFRAEMDTHVPVLSRGLLELEKGRAAEQEFEAMMRAAHSIKGAARIVGLEPAVRVAHVVEDCFTAAKAGRIDLSSDAVDVLLHAVDVLQRLCAAQAEPALDDEALQSLLERLGALREGKPPAGLHPPEAAPLAAAPLANAPLEVPMAGVYPPAEINVVLPPDIDLVSSEALRQALLDALRQTPARIRLDFAAVRQVSAGGLALLTSFAREAAGATPRPAVRAERVSPAVAALLHVTGLDGPFGVAC